MIKVFRHIYNSEAGLEDYLNDLQRQGWMIVSVVFVNGSTFAVPTYEIITKEKQFITLSKGRLW